VLSNWGAFTALDYFFEALALAAVVVELWAFVDALIRPSNAYPAAGKMTKVKWGLITGIAAAVGLGYAALVGNTSIIQILPVAAFVAACVYLTDVRPKVKQVGRGGSQSSIGPYGPW
jgi:hypothetical protein